MVLIRGGVTTIGDEKAPRPERPRFSMSLDSFWMDRTPVTVAQYRRFVEDTGYETQAERSMSSGVFDRKSGRWTSQTGANWVWPQGPNAPAADDNHPVTQVSWFDATRFCDARGLRLPTEFEWERAASMGQTPDGHVFSSADRLSVEGKYLVNVWQGLFPLFDSGEDGYRGVSPVGAFGETPAGLTDMAGNVWEWTASSYLPYPANLPERRGPGEERVQRGGSFLCDPHTCQGFRVTARSHATPDTSLEHVGFRCAADARP